MKIDAILLAALAFASLLEASPGADAMSPKAVFRGVDGVNVEEARIDQTITVRLRDLDGWLLNEIKQKRVAGEGFFKDGQLDILIQKLQEADAKSKPEDQVTYGDLLAKEYDALKAQSRSIDKLKQSIDHLKAKVNVLANEATDSLAARTEAISAKTGPTEAEPSRAPGAPPPAAGDDPTQARQKSAKAKQDLEEAQKAYQEAEKTYKTDQAKFKEDQAKWYSAWQAFQAWRALFRALRENLYLVLDNSHLEHVKAQNPFDDGMEEPATKTTIHQFQFALKKHPEDEKEWGKLYRGIKQRVPVAVALGFKLRGKSYTLDTLVRPGTSESAGGRKAGRCKEEVFGQEFSFLTYRSSSMATALGLVVLAFLLFLWLARNTELVRDAEPCPDGSQKFSLARCQTAFWFFLFVAAYVFLWDIKRQTDSLTEQCLVLLGISTGTLLGSALIGKPGESPAAPKSSINPNAKTFGKRPLFHDLLSDPSGEIVFYRFQTLVWTLVLGLVFIKSVCFSLQMPEFGTNELTLMGISAGTYIGFKIPEAKAEAAKADKSQPETGSPTSVATPDQTPPPDKNV